MIAIIRTKSLIKIIFWDQSIAATCHNAHKSILILLHFILCRERPMMMINALHCLKDARIFIIMLRKDVYTREDAQRFSKLVEASGYEWWCWKNIDKLPTQSISKTHDSCVHEREWVFEYCWDLVISMFVFSLNDSIAGMSISIPVWVRFFIYSAKRSISLLSHDSTKKLQRKRTDQVCMYLLLVTWDANLMMAIRIYQITGFTYSASVHCVFCRPFWDPGYQGETERDRCKTCLQHSVGTILTFVGGCQPWFGWAMCASTGKVLT